MLLVGASTYFQNLLLNITPLFKVLQLIGLGELEFFSILDFIGLFIQCKKTNRD